jgi:ABC-type transport system substrate-binding protein
MLYPLSYGDFIRADDSSVFACNQFPPAGFNIAFYCNPNLDKLYLQEQQMSDPSARQQVFNQIQQIYLLDYPFIVLYSPSDIGMVCISSLCITTTQAQRALRRRSTSGSGGVTKVNASSIFIVEHKSHLCEMFQIIDVI